MIQLDERVMSVIRECTTRQEVGDGTPPVHARGITRGLGARLAHVIPVPLGDLVASMRHPDGLPAFPQHGPRPTAGS